MSLGDHFPEELKRAHAEASVIIGAVIKMYVTDTNPPKEKRFIVIGESYDKIVYATIYINSEVNPNIFPTDELKALNINFDNACREYLDKPSFVDCSKLVERTKDELQELIKNNPDRHIGTLTKVDYDQLRGTIKTAPTIPISKKKKFGLFL